MRSEAEARRALELNPSLPDPHNMLSELAGLRGDQGEMVKQMESAYRLDPIRPHLIWLLGSVYLYVGREQEALELWKKTEQLVPTAGYRGMVEYSLIKGDFKKAKEFHGKAEKLEPTASLAHLDERSHCGHGRGEGDGAARRQEDSGR